MPNYTYVSTTVPGPPSYVLLQVTPPPAGYRDVHVTVPSDPPTPDANGRISNAEIWRQKHVTFVDAQGNTLHCFIKVVSNRYMPFDGTGVARNLDSGKKTIWGKLFADQAVIDAIF